MYLFVVMLSKPCGTSNGLD